MKKFMDKNFLLETKTARKLFFDVAKDMPIYDYHCHLSPQEIYEDKQFKNITEVWLGGDHYKWRFMRWMGVPEEQITGTASDYDKFMAYAKSIQFAAGNPLYHWSHLELQRYFGIYETLTEESAPAIWEKANAIIASGDFSARKLIEKSNVAFIGTTDDPTSDLKYHIALAEDDSFKTTVRPTFRPDPAVNIQKEEFASYIEKLGAVCKTEITDIDGLFDALESRIEFFHQVGSRISDHGIVSVPYAEADKEEVNEIFQRALAGEKIDDLEAEKYQTAVMLREQMIRMKPELEQKLPMESIIIASLLHDACKSNIYKETLVNRKNDQG
ncbi:MAG: glucuronate isomerase, partial [Clostridia bacterium]|nr:glucuronate isomerase [Clostridia bacterium]